MSLKEGVNAIELDKWTLPALRSECVQIFGDESLNSAPRLTLIQKLCVNTDKKYKNVYENWTTTAQKKELQARGEQTNGDGDALIARLRATVTPAKKHLDEVNAKSSPATTPVSKRSQSDRAGALSAKKLTAISSSATKKTSPSSPSTTMTTTTTPKSTRKRATSSSTVAVATSEAVTSSTPKNAAKSPSPKSGKPLKSILIGSSSSTTKTTPVKSVVGKKHRLQNSVSSTVNDDDDDDDNAITPPIDVDDGHKIEMHSEPPRKKQRRRSTLADMAASSERRRSVGFADVEIREYARRHGGGGGVPHGRFRDSNSDSPY